MKDHKLPGFEVHLLGRTAYSSHDPTRLHSLGIALERQQGVHAIASDRRVDFDTWPGTVARTPPGVDVFSESATGGEYLVVRCTQAHWEEWFDDAASAFEGRRVAAPGQRRALLLAHQLRRLLLCTETDALAIEQAALDFMGQQGPMPIPRIEALRPMYLPVLERMAAELDQPLGIAPLARMIHRAPLRFLREFSQLLGMTPHAYLVQARVQAARAMMRADDRSLACIAHDCGFSHQSHMGAAFRKHLGLTPGQYQARIRRAGKAVSLHFARPLPS
ncbi:L-rhamnose operon regulatory protein rhaS [Delftia tsuruhatensis]|uniref:helix-turn-helix domain-containing protein n=1 Tax=Delftia tsuruhatensis TaxID=180282 RepID=UPI001E6EFC2B|nr:AraC family transcriptional regulator [Delftia tsuruhatensis]CAB5707893.1 L-rhamnose operon regulatory protein rhaS [Delftia tsuruhatensis]CAC9680527.1 L-rhamnose operon regulatory protein rhaS [Delftia tsuruhatensis]